MSQLDRQKARRAALVQLQHLVDAIRSSALSAEDKAFMEQHVKHLWRFAEEAMGGEECRP